jgi:hypothetical protein
MMEQNSRMVCACRIRCCILLLLLVTSFASTRAQTNADSLAVDRRRLNSLIITAGVVYTAGLVTLNHVWYKNTERQSFRFFNDNSEWKQVDKAGHCFSSFYLSDLSARALVSSRVAVRKADVIGAMSGFLLTFPIEILDGYSDGYGASAGDLVADAAGSLIFLGQKLAWREVRIHPKFSFHRTGYAPLRPELLGDSWLSEMVKDYNGQTYWLAFDLDKFMSFPKWLNFAVGYGAQEMVYSRDGQNESIGFRPYRQYYLAIDFDLTSIKTRSKWVKALLYVVNSVHLPAPALEFSPRGSKFHGFYF